MRAILVGLLLAGAVAVEVPRRTNRTMRLVLDGPHEELFDTFATRGFRGNRSKAFAALIDLHAGRGVEELERIRGAELQPVEVESWRPVRLSRDLIGRVARIVLDGGPPSTAFAALAVPEHQRRAWLKQGRSDRLAGRTSIHADLAAALERAQAQLELDRVARLEGENPKWLLERQLPEQYGQRTRVESEHTHRLLPAIDWDRLTVQETRQLVELLRRASPTADEARVDLGAKARPVLELLPGDVVEEPDDPEAPHLDAEAPALDGPEAPALEAPLLEGDDGAGPGQAGAGPAERGAALAGEGAHVNGGPAADRPDGARRARPAQVE